MGEDEVANDVQAGKQEHTDLQRTKKEKKQVHESQGRKKKSQDHYFVWILQMQPPRVLSKTKHFQFFCVDKQAGGQEKKKNPTVLKGPDWPSVVCITTNRESVADWTGGIRGSTWERG